MAPHIVFCVKDNGQLFNYVQPQHKNERDKKTAWSRGETQCKVLQTRKINKEKRKYLKNVIISYQASNHIFIL